MGSDLTEIARLTDDATRAILPGLWLWVWQPRAAPANALDHYRGAFVRAANGNGVKSNKVSISPPATGAGRTGSERNGARLGRGCTRERRRSKRRRPFGASARRGGSQSARVYRRHRGRGHARHRTSLRRDPQRADARHPVGFSSYPTRRQARRFGVPWDALVRHCDFGSPQVYHRSQAREIVQVFADHAGKPVHVALFSDAPNEPWRGWVTGARELLRVRGGISIWAYPVNDEWDADIASLAKESPSESHAQPLLLAVELATLDLRRADATPLRHRLVSHLQALLLAKGELEVHDRPIDGIAGSRTRAALLRLQRASNLDDDAVVGEQTWRALLR